MDIGDIIRLLFLLFIFLSFFGGVFGRGRREEQQRQEPSPRDISQSGGQERPRQQQPQRPPQERQMPSTPTEWLQEVTGQRSAPDERQQQQPKPRAQRQPERQVVTYDDAIERGISRTDARREERLERYGGELQQAQQAVREAEREMLESEIDDMPEPMELHPESRRREAGPARPHRRRRRTGGDVLRRALDDPDTLARAFVLKEVLDEPLALRRD